MSEQTVSVPQIKVATYQAPRVTITPVQSVIPSEPVAGAHAPGGYQNVLLNTRTGELSFHESTEHREPWNPHWKAVNDVPRETWTRWHPGKPFLPGSGPHMWFEPVPELLNWHVDSGFSGHPYLDVEAANALLELVAPYAQELLDGFFESGGELDWSAASARAGRQLCRLTSRHREAAAPGVDADLVDFAAIVQRFPQVYRPELLSLSLDKLAEECEYQTRFIGANEHWRPEVKEFFGTPYRDGTGKQLEVLGVRSWYRTVLLQGDPRPARDFGDWDAQQHRLAASGITSESTDAELDAWIRDEELRAAQQGVRLFGTKDAAYSHRARLREQDWDRLAVVGAECARLQKYLAERRQLVTRAISWGYGDSDIAGRARVSRQAVHKLREKADGQADDPELA
ncbi:hypothetical protein SHJG_p253 (plasmid) [Streptomyces hygroscopicus subsp. jinggangensis 5008]|nr:hypothetical protein SHJG_p253 [Streptomyces hygroscopicus subsp. jinggangensis 5008]AGF68522.1 hypothetical protein SHJGH_p253 [Streptomyces hygroscopicus subsp. jinggangensis TL01]